MKLYVIGHEDAVLGLSLVGVGGYATADKGEASAKLDEALADPDLGVLMVTADIAQQLPAEMEAARNRAGTPLILEIPAPGQPVRRGSLRELIRRAVGVSI